MCRMDLNDIPDEWRQHLCIRELRLSACEIAVSDAATTASMAGRLRVLHLVRCVWPGGVQTLGSYLYVPQGTAAPCPDIRNPSPCCMSCAGRSLYPLPCTYVPQRCSVCTFAVCAVLEWRIVGMHRGC